MNGYNKESRLLSMLWNNTRHSTINTTSTTIEWAVNKMDITSENPVIIINSIPTFPADQFDTEEAMSQCFSSPEDYDVVTAMITATLMVLGVLLVFYGYRCLKSVLFLVGFLFASTLIYLICVVEDLISFSGNVSISLVAGLLFALITMLVGYVGLFMLGFHLGLLSAAVALIVIHLLVPFVDSIEAPSNPWMILGIFMSMGLIGACGNLYFQKGLSIVATVIYGSTLTLLCVDYYIENFKLLFWFRDKLRDGSGYGNDDLLTSASSVSSTRSTTLCLVSWVVMSAWPLTVLFGLLIQCCLTSKGIDYHNDYHYGMVSSTASRNTCQVRVKSESESKMSEQKQKEYRYWYQVRRTHGDVISRQCLQTLHKQKNFYGDDNLTYNSNVTMIPTDHESRTTTMSIA